MNNLQCLYRNMGSCLEDLPKLIGGRGKRIEHFKVPVQSKYDTLNSHPVLNYCCETDIWICTS